MRRITPAACRSATWSATRPLCRPSLRRSCSALSTAAGTLPMPIWITSPSSIEARDVGPDPPDLVGPAGARQRQERSPGLDHVIEALVRYLVARTRPRHRGVDLGHDQLRPRQDRGHEMDRDPEAALAPIVRRRHLDQGEIDRQGAQILPDAAVVQRQEADPAGGMRSGDRAGDEEAREAGSRMEGGGVDDVQPGDQAADVVDASTRRGGGRQRLEQGRRLAAGTLHEHRHAGAEQVGQAVGGDRLRIGGIGGIGGIGLTDGRAGRW